MVSDIQSNERVEFDKTYKSTHGLDYFSNLLLRILACEDRIINLSPDCVVSQPQ